MAATRDNVKISVIVPIYNAEPYLQKCLDSIQRQTHRNMEIILVDDGSPDNCGKICDKYAAIDPRVLVIHKENGGVSSARNVGLSRATGEWIGWVDSDDWVEADIFAYLLENALKYNADIAVCGRFEQYREKGIFQGWQQIQNLDTEKALELLLQNDVMQSFLWDKLWRRELFEGLSFPEGHTFEDVAVMHRLFIRARQVICLPEAKYHYLQHSKSIVDNISLKNKINYYAAAKLRQEEMIKDWPQFSALLTGQCAAAAIGVWAAYWANPRKERGRFMPQIQEIAAFSKKNYKIALKTMTLGMAGRAVLRLTPFLHLWAFWLANMFSKIYKIRHGRYL